MGNWGQTLACEDNKWVEGIDVRYIKRDIARPTVGDTPVKDELGIVQMRLRCNNHLGNAESFKGKIYRNPASGTGFLFSKGSPNQRKTVFIWALQKMRKFFKQPF